MRKSPSAPQKLMDPKRSEFWYIRSETKITKRIKIHGHVANLPGIFTTVQVQFMPNQGGEERVDFDKHTHMRFGPSKCM